MLQCPLKGAQLKVWEGCSKQVATICLHAPSQARAQAPTNASTFAAMQRIFLCAQAFPRPPDPCTDPSHHSAGPIPFPSLSVHPPPPLYAILLTPTPSPRTPGSDSAQAFTPTPFLALNQALKWIRQCSGLHPYTLCGTEPSTQMGCLSSTSPPLLSGAHPCPPYPPAHSPPHLPTRMMVPKPSSFSLSLSFSCVRLAASVERILRAMRGAARLQAYTFDWRTCAVPSCRRARALQYA